MGLTNDAILVAEPAYGVMLFFGNGIFLRRWALEFVSINFTTLRTCHESTIATFSVCREALGRHFTVTCLTSNPFSAHLVVLAELLSIEASMTIVTFVFLADMDSVFVVKLTTNGAILFVTEMDRRWVETSQVVSFTLVVKEKDFFAFAVNVGFIKNGCGVGVENSDTNVENGGSLFNVHEGPGWVLRHTRK